MRTLVLKDAVHALEESLGIVILGERRPGLTGVLTERNGVCSVCMLYLTALRKHKSDGHPMILEGRKCIHGIHTTPKNCTDMTNILVCWC
jgi:hypothetical protein